MIALILLISRARRHIEFNSPCPLLESLSTGTDHQSVKEGTGSQKPLVFEQTGAEGDIVHAVSLLSSFALDKAFSLQSAEFVLNGGVFGLSASEFGEGNKRLFLSAWTSACVAPQSAGLTSEHEPSRGEGEEPGTEAEDNSGDELNTKGESPSSVGLADECILIEGGSTNIYRLADISR
jgi:hypothetical protein